MRQFTVGKFIITAEDSALYLRDRHVIQVTTTTGGSVVLRMSDYNGYECEMSVNLSSTNKTIKFDITDIVRSYSIGEIIPSENVSVICAGTSQAISYTVAGLVNPEYLPPHPYPNKERTGSRYIKMFAPNMILQDLGEGYPHITFETYGMDNRGEYICYDDSGTELYNQPFSQKSEVATNTEYILFDISGIQDYTQYLVPLKCGRKYAMVQWESSTGVTRCATWELRQVSNQVTDTVDIESMASPLYVANTHPVDERRGYETHAVLHLDGLTAYDYWYYADLITSNKVTVFVEEGGTKMANYVKVVTQSATIPDSDVSAPYSLDIEIIMNRYDTI